MHEFQHLFELSISGEKVTINFNTPLGKLVFYNMLILDTDWWPIQALPLTKNAYFIYKRFIMYKRSGKFKSKNIVLKLDEVKEFLDMNWSNNRGINIIIVKALDDMVRNGLVEDYKINKIRPKQRFYELRFESKK